MEDAYLFVAIYQGVMTAINGIKDGAQIGVSIVMGIVTGVKSALIYKASKYANLPLGEQVFAELMFIMPGDILLDVSSHKFAEAKGGNIITASYIDFFYGEKDLSSDSAYIYFHGEYISSGTRCALYR